MMYIATQEWVLAAFKELLAQWSPASPAIMDTKTTASFWTPLQSTEMYPVLPSTRSGTYDTPGDEPYATFFPSSAIEIDAPDLASAPTPAMIEGINSPINGKDVRKNKGIFWRRPTTVLESSSDEPYGAFVIGNASVATSKSSAVGSFARAWNQGSVAMGYQSIAGAGTLAYDTSTKKKVSITYWDDVASAFKRTYRQSASTAIGAYTQAGSSCTSIGAAAKAWLSSGTAIGAAANCGGESATAVGQGSTAGGDYSTAVGDTATASAQYATAIGYKAVVSAAPYASGTYREVTSNTKGTTEVNRSVALGAFSIVPEGETDVVSVGNDGSNVVVENYFNGVTDSYQAYGDDTPWGYTDQEVPVETLYRRIINVADPINEHDVVTLGYLKSHDVPKLERDTDGAYTNSSILTYVNSVASQSAKVTITKAGATVSPIDIGSPLVPGQGILWRRNVLVESSKIMWIEGIDDEESAYYKPQELEHFVLTKPLDVSSHFDHTSGAFTATFTASDGAILYPAYAGSTAKPSQLPVTNSTFGYSNTKVVEYLQSRWLLEWSKRAVSKFMGYNRLTLKSPLTLVDPTKMGYEYGEQMSMYLDSTVIKTNLKVGTIPEGTKITLTGKSSDGDKVLMDTTIITSFGDEDTGVVEMLLGDTFTYNEGDTWTVEFGTNILNGSVTHKADGWENLSAESSLGQWYGTGFPAALSLEWFLSVQPYKLGGVETGFYCDRLPLQCTWTGWEQDSSLSAFVRTVTFSTGDGSKVDTIKVYSKSNTGQTIESYRSITWLPNNGLFVPTAGLAVGMGMNFPLNAPYFNGSSAQSKAVVLSTDQDEVMNSEAPETPVSNLSLFSFKTSSSYKGTQLWRSPITITAS